MVSSFQHILFQIRLSVFIWGYLKFPFVNCLGIKAIFWGTTFDEVSYFVRNEADIMSEVD